MMHWAAITMAIKITQRYMAARGLEAAPEPSHIFDGLELTRCGKRSIKRAEALAASSLDISHYFWMIRRV